MKKSIGTALLGAVLITSALVAAPASAQGRGGHDPVRPGTPVTLTDGLFTPLSLEVDRRGTVYVSQDFAGLLTKVDRDGTTTTVTSAPGHGIGAVSSRRGTIYYAESDHEAGTAVLKSITDGAAPVTLADLWAYEADNNPDQDSTYGFIDLPQECADQFDPSVPPNLPAEYTGTIDSNPYSTLALKEALYVADAGANAILRVDYDGTISTVAVLPSGDPVRATEEVLADVGLPTCAAGYKYRFEPVPTDVEQGPDGWLYVTTLPGGPEDASLGARGSVYKVNPDSGKVVRVATGFTGATGLAVSGSGTVYVAELFGGPDGTGQVSTLARGSDRPRLLITLSSPAAFELHDGSLYVTTDAFVPDATGGPQPIGEVTVVPLNGRDDD